MFFPTFRALARRLSGASLMLAAAILPMSLPAAADTAPALSVSDAWARPTPPGAQVGVAYGRLHNASGDAVTVSAVSSDVSEAAELHEMAMRDGMMRMRHLKDGLHIEAGQSASLAPGGTHVMLFRLRQPLHEGDRITLRFRLSDGREVVVDAPVRTPAS